MDNEIDAQEAMTQGALAWNTLHALFDALKAKGVLTDGEVKEIVKAGAEMLVDRYGDDETQAELQQTFEELEAGKSAA
jgi:uncharacterized protein HemY